MLPRLRLSRVVWLILISQVLSLAVVSTALWDFRKDIGVSTPALNTYFSLPGPDTLTGPAGGGLDRPLTATQPVRIIGETRQILDCITNVLLARRLASRYLASETAGLELNNDPNDPNDSIGKIDSDCGPPKALAQPVPNP